MAQRLRGAVSEPSLTEDRSSTVESGVLPHPLPEKAEAALREAGLWSEQFVRQLAQLDRVTLDALGVIGAWDDLDWEDMAAAFDRMRHENPPSPPVEL